MVGVMLFPHPEMPWFPPDKGVTTEQLPRYEDIAMDGRMMPIALPPAMSTLWQATIVNAQGARNSIAKGIIPILSRLTINTVDQPVRVDRPVRSRGGWELAHSKENGEVARIFMNVWCEVSGLAGRIGPRQSADAEYAVAGALFAEHTFTRPLAPPDQRRVSKLEGVEGWPEVPPSVYDAPKVESAGDMPAGARWTDELSPDAAEIVFTLDQTDSNQHVNSLQYIRVFMEAANRRVAAAGHALKIRSRSVEIAYRKPCFAGDRVRAHLRLFELDGQPGAAGFIASDDGKPRCFVRVAYGR